MPSGAHFQVAKTVIDFIRAKTKDDIKPTRREMVAELRPVMKLLNRSEATMQQMIDTLQRMGCIRNVRGFYVWGRGIDWPRFAEEVDRNNPERRMIITFVYPDDDPDTHVKFDKCDDPFTIEEVRMYTKLGLKIVRGMDVSDDGKYDYMVFGKRSLLIERLKEDFKMSYEDIAANMPHLV